MLPVFDVIVLMTFRFMFVHIIFSLVWVAEWPPFKKAAHSVNHVFTLYFEYLVISCFGLMGWILVWIVPVPGRYILVTFTQHNIDIIIF